MEFKWPDAQHIYLSPHLDDVILSCGGIIAQQVERGESVSVVTVFAGSPPVESELSDFARSLHERWQVELSTDVNVSDLPAVRRIEDRLAFEIISPDIEVVHWALTDCIYRIGDTSGEYLYASEEGIFGNISYEDPAVITLRNIAPPPVEAMLYVPLSAGGHVDHKIVRQAVAHWRTPEKLTYYEDYPYAEKPEAVAQFINALWTSEVVPLTDRSLTAKLNALEAYASQISTFWQGIIAMKQAIREYAAQVGGERLWKYGS